MSVNTLILEQSHWLKFWSDQSECLKISVILSWKYLYRIDPRCQILLVGFRHWTKLGKINCANSYGEIYLKFWSLQRDQTEKLFFHFWAIYYNENMPNGHKNSQSRLKIGQIQNKFCKSGEISPSLVILIPVYILWRRIWKLAISVTRSGDLLDFRQLFKAFGNN